MGFLNVALVRLLNFSQFMEKMENWDFCFLVWVGCTFKIALSFTLRITISFIFRQIANLSDMYLRGGANLWWNCQFSSKKTFIFMQQFCISLSTGNIVSKLTVNEAKNCKIFLGLTPRLAAVFGRNCNCLPEPCFADCFTSGISPGDAFEIFVIDMFLL